MAINYPTSKDTSATTNIRPSATDVMTGGTSVGGPDVIDKVYTEIEALETKVGITSDPTTTSHDYKLSGVTTGDKAMSLTGTEIGTNKTFTTPTLNSPILNTPSVLTMANNVYVQGKEVGGTARSLIGVNTSDQIVIGNTTSNLRINNRIKFRAFRNTSNQSIGSSSTTKIQFNGETFDSANTFDSVTNFRWTPGLVGDYQVNAHVTTDSSASFIVFIYVNGAEYSRGTNYTTAASSQSAIVADVVHLTATSDYIEIHTFSTVAFNVISGTNQTSMSGFYISD